MVTFKIEVSSKKFAGSIESVWPKTVPDEKKEKSNSRYKIDFIISKLSGLKTGRFENHFLSNAKSISKPLQSHGLQRQRAFEYEALLRSLAQYLSY